MVKFPVKIEVQASGGSGMVNNWTSQAGSLAPIPCAIPPEFMGPGGGYSPEDLFALALLNCIIAILKVYCEKSKVSFREVNTKCILSVDRIPAENIVAITHADVTIDVEGSSDPEKVRKILDSCIKDCIVSNSIKTGKTFHLNVN